MIKDKLKKLFDLLITKYILIIYSEENFEPKITFKLNYARILSFCFVLFSLFTIFGFLVSTTVLSRYFDPRSKQKKLEKKIVFLLKKIDTLEYNTNINDQYIESLQTLFNPKYIERQEADKSMTKEDSESLIDITELSELSDKELEFRREYEQSNVKKGAYVLNEDRLEARNHLFFPPISSLQTVVSYRGYSSTHYGIDINVEKNELILAVATGTVVFSYWTENDGYIIGIQHENGFISVYKHNSKLLKKQGDKVDVGQAIAVIGNTGTNTSGQHLHFELWFKGNPIDPTDLIYF